MNGEGYEIRVTGFVDADNRTEYDATEGRAREVMREVRSSPGVRHAVIRSDSRPVFEGHRPHYGASFKIELDDLTMRTMPDFRPTTLGRAGDKKPGRV